MCNVTGFYFSKKLKENDPYVQNLFEFARYLREAQPCEENLNLEFYLGALLYPQDLKRHLSSFASTPQAKETQLSLIKDVH